MRCVVKLSAVLFVCAFAVSQLQAQTPRNVRVNYKQTTLKNGLRVITVEDHDAPVIAIAVNYNVGSRDERQGRTGAVFSRHSDGAPNRGEHGDVRLEIV